MDWIKMVYIRVLWRAFVNTVMILMISLKLNIFVVVS
jgi:hypothetical protein